MIIDISPLLDHQTAVWPGDIRLRRISQFELKRGHSVELSSLQSTVHIGAHADAPSHYSVGAASIDQVALDPYIGPCRVITVPTRPGGLVRIDDLVPYINKVPERILLRTLSFPDPQQFVENFMAIDPDTIDLLAAQGVRLIGIDTPSVDPIASKTLTTHHRLLHHGMRNLEGLVLVHVSPGDYELIALPLRLAGFDASPVRAILRPLK